MPDFDPKASDYYARLGIDAEAAGDDVRKAYRRVAREVHPDRNPGDPDAALRFRRVREAYEVLSDDEARRRYDAQRTSTVTSTGLTAHPDLGSGCFAYAAWRVLVGVIAAVIFVVLEMAGMWELHDAETTTWAIIGAVVVAGVLAFAAAHSFENEASDYSVQFKPQHVTVYVQGHPWARVKWGDVHRLAVDPGRQQVELRTSPSAGQGIREQPPIIRSVRPANGEVRVTLDFSGTDLSVGAIYRFAQTVDGVRAVTVGSEG